VSTRNSDHGTTSKVGRKVAYSSDLDRLLRFGGVRYGKNAPVAIRKFLRSTLCTRPFSPGRPLESLRMIDSMGPTAPSNGRRTVALTQLLNDFIRPQ